MYDTIVTIDNGQDSGVRIERHDDHHGASWLELTAGALEVGVNFQMTPTIEGGPVILYMHRCEIDGPWTLDDLRALHRDLGRLLADKRLPGAMDEAWAYYDAHPKPAEA